MRADILQSKNSAETRSYVNKKFNRFNSWTYWAVRQEIRGDGAPAVLPR
jgi:hypothetical protein